MISQAITFIRSVFEELFSAPTEPSSSPLGLGNTVSASGSGVNVGQSGSTTGESNTAS